MGRIRTFVAVDVAAAIRQNAARMIRRLAVTGVDYRWVEPETMHITLNFLGDVEEAEIPEVCRRIRDSVDGAASFSIEVAGLGCFPRPDRPRVLWLGLAEGSQELTDLNDRIASGLEAMRFPRDRNDFHPHLTLGRLQRGGHWNDELLQSMEKDAQFSAGGCLVDEVVIYSSYLDRSGPTHTPMSRIPLN